MPFVLFVILLSSGLHVERFSSLTECEDHLVEYRIIAKKDVWSGTCAGPELKGDRPMVAEK